jgi:hypothetical protein
MKIRTYQKADFDRVRSFGSEAKYGFEFPNPEDRRVVIKECLTDDEGIVRMAAFGRLQANAYLLVDGTWKSPEERLEAIEILEFAMVEKAKVLNIIDGKGLDQATAQVDPRFGQRLKALGWDKSIGETWHKEF